MINAMDQSLVSPYACAQDRVHLVTIEDGPSDGDLNPWGRWLRWMLSLLAGILIVIEIQFSVELNVRNSTVVPTLRPKPLPGGSVWRMSLRDFECGESGAGYICGSDELFGQ